METQQGNWVSEAEEVLRSLRDVQGVSILAEDRNIREVHITAMPGRSAKQIVRDVETCLRTRFSIGIDHRVVSVAFFKAPRAGAQTPSAPAAGGGSTEGRDVPHAGVTAATTAPAASTGSLASEAAPRGRAATAPPAVAAEPAETLRPARSEGRPGAPAARTSDSRVRFVSVNVYVSGPRVQAQVELRWKGVSRMGSSSGWASRDSAHRLVAAATLAALQEFLEESWAMSLQNVEFVRFGREEVAVAGLSLITHRHEKLLAGCCPVEQDAHQAVVLATLAAVNRVVGGLPTREPTEYVLRPASRQEESGAKKF